MKYIIILMLCVICTLKAQSNDSLNNQKKLNKYMSEYALNNIKDIYRLSKTYPPARDSLISIVKFLDGKIISGEVFSPGDRYTTSKYETKMFNVVDGKEIWGVEKLNYWSYILARLNIVDEQFYSDKKNCEILEKVYCSLNHEGHIDYNKKHGQPYSVFTYLLYQKKYKEFEKLTDEDFVGFRYELRLNTFIEVNSNFIKSTLISYDDVSKENADIHPKVKKFYLSVLNYLEWDKDFVTMKKVLSEIDSDFGSDSDFGKFRAMVAQ